VLIYKASGVFNFAQGIMVVFAALTLVGLHELGVPAFAALALTLGVMLALAYAVERIMLRRSSISPRSSCSWRPSGSPPFSSGSANSSSARAQSDDCGQLYLPKGAIDFKILGGFVSLQKIDIAAAVIAAIMVAGLAVFFQKTRIGRALRAVADSHKAALSVGISLEQIWVIVWFAAGIVALTTGIMWGARSNVSFALEIVALKALPVLVLGGFTRCRARSSVASSSG